MSLAYVGILNSSMPKMSEEGLTLSLTGIWPAFVSLLEACLGPLRRTSLAEKRRF